MLTSREQIEKYVEQWTQEKIGPDFTFRLHQKETIINIIENILTHKYKNYIVEAPTGSGKSLINIISAGVLADFYEMDSYILVSDLFLWEQYENFLKKYKNTGIASLKGQTGNYCCSINGEDVRNAECRMADISWTALFNPNTIEKYGFTCAYTCEYVQARKRAIRSRVCIMTYQLFLFVMNNPQSNIGANGQPIWKQRDILFCDECHNIPSIVQLQYAPTVVEDSFERLEIIYEYGTRECAQLFTENSEEQAISEKLTSKYPTKEAFRNVLDSCWKVWTNGESRKDEDMEAINKYMTLFSSLKDTCDKVKSNMSMKKLNHLTVTKEDVKMFKLATWYENTRCHWNDFNKAILETGKEYLLKDITIVNEDKHISVSFKCTKEDYLVYMYLLSNAHYKVFCSATIGGKLAYDENMGFRYDVDPDRPDELNESYLDTVPSSFDFSQSPIHFLNKFKMSYKEREISFRHLKNVIYSICNTKFKDQKGMIQTGSYYLAEQLYNDAPFEIKQRMLVYNGSREKNTMVALHKMSTDTILVGPTLNTGVDLPGEECRFIIILKVPYPSIADKLVKEKIKLFPLWYNSSTSNEIIQGIGRGVRFDGDWCVTYILDACFWSLYQSTKDQYPPELQKRINVI